jgi:hypothetical protein
MIDPPNYSSADLRRLSQMEDKLEVEEGNKDETIE